MGQDGGETVDWATRAEQLTAEFFDAMQRMYIGAGEPALRTLAARNNRLSASNLSALFSGKRTALPNYEVMTAVVDALLYGAPPAEREQEQARWKQRWADVRYASRQAQKARAEGAIQAANILADARAQVERMLADAERTAADILDAARTEASHQVAVADQHRTATAAAAEDIIARATAQARQTAEEIVATARAEATAVVQKAADRIGEGAKIVTERFNAAVAQLGNDAAAVRLAGVYALTRIADDSERDRPSSLKALCAYLRMPYGPDAPAERLVRAVVNAAIADRLRPEHPGFWPDAEIDLSGARLVNLGFDGITVHTLNADGATFHGDAGFYRATFHGDARFDKATFHGNARFAGVTFNKNAAFGMAVFNDNAVFGATMFNDNAVFSMAKFNKTVRFDEAVFNDNAGFGATAFRRFAVFDRVTFKETSWFREVTFDMGAMFREVTFGKNAVFSGATFNKKAVFSGATFNDNVVFSGATFRRDHSAVWPAGLAEPSDIVWVDPPTPDPGTLPDPDSDPPIPPSLP